MKNQITFEQCDFKKKHHEAAFTQLLNHYMKDPMGDSEPIDALKQAELVSIWMNHGNAATLFVKVDDEYVGLVNYFYLISTFKVKPYVYIHDVIVHQSFRGKDLGRKLLEQIIEIAKEKNCCKIMLEVRNDNTPALSLYSSLGFEECSPRNYSWTKIL